MKNNSVKQRGFTLLEVMVVLVILGIIAGMVVPNIMGNQAEAQAQKVMVDIRQLENALDMYKLKNNVYPTTEQGLESLVTAPTIEPIPRNFPQDGFIKRLPKDPWGNDYQLLNPGEMGTIDVFSNGPDGEPGSDDDIGNWEVEQS